MLLTLNGSIAITLGEWNRYQLHYSSVFTYNASLELVWPNGIRPTLFEFLSTLL